MISSYLEYDERTTVEAILRHNGVEITDKLMADLSMFCNWTRADEKAKTAMSRGTEPPFLLCLLSMMGIYGEAALTPARSTPAA